MFLVERGWKGAGGSWGLMVGVFFSERGERGWDSGGVRGRKEGRGEGREWDFY